MYSKGNRKYEHRQRRVAAVQVCTYYVSIRESTTSSCWESGSVKAAGTAVDKGAIIAHKGLGESQKANGSYGVRESMVERKREILRHFYLEGTSERQ